MMCGVRGVREGGRKKELTNKITAFDHTSCQQLVLGFGRFGGLGFGVCGIRSKIGSEISTYLPTYSIYYGTYT